MEVETVAPCAFALPHQLGFDPPADACGAPDPPGEQFEFRAATKLQKVYRSYRTRRRLADSAVVAEELWWRALDFARLSYSTVSFFNYAKPETAVSRWSRVSLNASKVGQGLLKDEKAIKLAFQHWIEAIDPRHRYGHNLNLYYEKWCKSEAGQPFFFWLDIGDGRDVDLKECPRSLLRKQCIKYFGPQEREHYEYVPFEGKIVHKKTGEVLDTSVGREGAKWIFVMSTTQRLYAGEKKKGIFHHSSFLAGGTTTAAGRFTAENGVLKSIWAYSGHYRPSEENLNNFLSFLRENGIDLSKVQIRSSSKEDYYDDEKKPPEEDIGAAAAHEETQNLVADSKVVELMEISAPPQLKLPSRVVKASTIDPEVPSQVDGTAASQSEKTEESRHSYRRTLSGGLNSPRADVSQKAILKRIKSKRGASSYQLGHQLSLKWCSGAGPRIGCVADYPPELRRQALEFVKLSPGIPTPGSRLFCTSPTCSLPADPPNADINSDAKVLTVSDRC